jgi:hypothetical protein
MARAEILAAARNLAGRSADGTFTITEVLAEMRHPATAYVAGAGPTPASPRLCEVPGRGLSRGLSCRSGPLRGPLAVSVAR